MNFCYSVKVLVLILPLLIVTGCFANKDDARNKELELKMNKIAEGYVKLVLKVGLHDPDYVDAYYGPAEWKPADSSVVKNDSTVIQNLYDESGALLDSLDLLGKAKASEIETLRFTYLYKQLLAVRSKIFMLAGGKFTFDDEAKNLYDVEVPVHDTNFFVQALNELETLLPGEGNIGDRIGEFKKSFIIPVQKLDAVFQAAISECRKRTLQHLNLPKNENFKVEYVPDAPWGAYNWYKGNSFSVIQINTKTPVYIDRAVGLAAHEGYPGHHVYNALLEQKMVKENGWKEFSVYPLFCPQSLIAEGTANFGIDVAFPGDSRMKFEKEILFPLAGLDQSKAELYYKISKLQENLDYACIEAARSYLDGKINREEAKLFLQKYAGKNKDRAEQLMRFIDKYRSYVINYSVGQDIVSRYITRHGGDDEHPDQRWKLMERLLSTPQVPSNLK